MKHIVFVLLIFVCISAPAQAQGKDIVFHVTSVAQGKSDACTNSCDATLYTVEGYVPTGRKNSIQYVLNCVEILAFKPEPHQITQCVHVHSHEEYQATLFVQSIAFKTASSSDYDSSDPNKQPTLIPYSIKSEKER